MRRQTSTSGINPAGSSRAMRLDPLSLPLSFHAQDARADGGVRRVELHRERVVLRRAVQGMRMAVNVRVSDFLGVALRGLDDAQMLVLVHRDPSLNIPLGASADRDEIASAWQMWSDIFQLPQLPEDKAERTGGPASPSQRDPRPASEISGAASRRRFAQPGEYPSGRARDHRAGLSVSSRHIRRRHPEVRALRPRRMAAHTGTSHPSRLTEDGEHLRMTDRLARPHHRIDQQSRKQQAARHRGWI